MYRRTCSGTPPETFQPRRVTQVSTRFARRVSEPESASGFRILGGAR